MTQTAAANTCDWCGAVGPIRMRAYGEDACAHCAPYMHAAMQHPEYAEANRLLASYHAEHLRSHFG